MAEQKEVKWTKEQLDAIRTRDKTLIVAAAAGSGKTATLIERILRQITDPENPVDLSSILVVTYTKAAAEELRTRIGKALRSALAENPADKNLERQLLTVNSAHIQTIDSFCQALLTSSADAVGISPDFRICDKGEGDLLSATVMENLINEVYDGNRPAVASPEGFEELADALTATKRSNELSKTFLSLYTKCSGQIDGVRSIRKLVDLYDPAVFTSPSDTVFGKYARDEVARFCLDTVTLYERYIRLLLGGNPSEDAFARFLEQEKTRLLSFVSAKTYADVKKAASTFAVTGSIFLPAVRTKSAEVTPDLSEIKVLRTECKNKFVEILPKYFLWTDEEWLDHFQTIFRTGSVLCNFLEAFDREFSAEKRRLNLLDFSDLEHLAHRALYQSDGSLSPLALSTKENFKAVYIDEYQDVNQLQDAIFSAISLPDNRFMVGDIKQCIYCFRGSEPSIFAGMRSRFPSLEEAAATGAKQASLFMSQNFRCDAPVLAFANGIFDKIFPLATPELGHDEEKDTLRVGKDPEKQGAFIPELHLVPKPEKTEGITPEAEREEALGEPFSDGYDAEGVKEKREESNRARQAYAVAKKVVELLKEGKKNDGSPIECGDIAILLRKFKNVAPYRKALEKAGIPTVLAESADLFSTPEVLLALSLLSVLDNPHREIYLTGLLCSPLFSFTGDEILRLRRAGGDTLCDALRLATDPEAVLPYPGEISDALRKKTADFLAAVSHYRAISRGMRTDLLLSRLYRETGLLALASNTGAGDNLLALQNFAKNYEQNGFHGLSGFLAYVREMIENGTKFEGKESAKNKDAVTLMTDHKSKGLEFPVCILAECQVEFKDVDKASYLSFAPGFGISYRDRAPGGLARVDNAVHNLVDDRIFANLYSEELRILYVAVTRAKERLYLFGNVDEVEKYVENARIKKENLTPYSSRHLKSFLEVAMMSSGAYRVVKDDVDTSVPLSLFGSAAAPSAETVSPKNEPTLSSADRSATEDFDGFEPLSDEEKGLSAKETLLSRFRFSYPSPAETALPRKLSVSVLSPVVLDSTENEEIALTIEEFLGEKGEDAVENEHNSLQKTALPAFYTGESADLSKKQGIATHTFLQFCNFASLQKNGADAELSRLLSAGFLSAEDGELVALHEIRKFEASSLVGELCRAKRVWRELRFHSKLPAEDFARDEDRKRALRGKILLVQGVIDCIYEDEAGSLHLIDYKTDRLPDAALKDKSYAQNILAKKHSLQLSYYSRAIEKMFGKRPATVEVYSLPLGDTVDVSGEKKK